MTALSIAKCLPFMVAGFFLATTRVAAFGKGEIAVESPSHPVPLVHVYPVDDATPYKIKGDRFVRYQPPPVPIYTSIPLASAQLHARSKGLAYVQPSAGANYLPTQSASQPHPQPALASGSAQYVSQPVPILPPPITQPLTAPYATGPKGEGFWGNINGKTSSLSSSSTGKPDESESSTSTGKASRKDNFTTTSPQDTQEKDGQSDKKNDDAQRKDGGNEKGNDEAKDGENSKGDQAQNDKGKEENGESKNDESNAEDKQQNNQ